jgi:hypothetical protein
MVVCMRKPMPTPRTAMNTPVCHGWVCTSCRESRNMATAMTAQPTTGKALYFPVGVFLRDPALDLPLCLQDHPLLDVSSPCPSSSS